MEEKSTIKSKYEEGCLSVPGQFAEIERPDKCHVKYLDYQGNSKEIFAEGIKSPRQMTEGKKYIYTASGPKGEIYALLDVDNDNKIDSSTVSSLPAALRHSEVKTSMKLKATLFKY